MPWRNFMNLLDFLQKERLRWDKNYLPLQEILQTINKKILIIDDPFVYWFSSLLFQIVEFIAYIIIPIVITLFVVIYWAVGFVQYNNPNFWALKSQEKKYHDTY